MPSANHGLVSHAALQIHSAAAPNDCFVAKCMILMENGNPRDGLDHILDAVWARDLVSENYIAVVAQARSD
jgi:hypothetical protein